MSAPVKADLQAADRVLKAAVRRAAQIVAEVEYEEVVSMGRGVTVRFPVSDHVGEAAAVLEHAACAASYLIDPQEVPA